MTDPLLLFSKPAIPLSDQVTLLRQRGMCIEDPPAAEQKLLEINYYRFCGYALCFEEPSDGERSHRYREGTSFQDVIELCDFDSRIRSVLLAHLERVEVTFRTVVCYEVAIQTDDPHWYLDQALYDERFGYAKARVDWHKAFERSDEIFASSYRAKYNYPPLPPAWMMTEILSLGSWSRIYSSLDATDLKSTIAARYSVSHPYLASWMHCLTVLRNLCAHHCRVWDRHFTAKPRLTRSLKKRVTGNGRLAAQVLVIGELLGAFGHREAFDLQWESLVATCPKSIVSCVDALLPT